ncbi:unnamed protein product [Caenorhabditis auriculariae]|uniref:Uncharacterized protein n=1 Tax=Caenorhabditis auriculariae TaxID=2777116 RepID=A0A8S1HQY1_9PELO|nr:unnamed protein product [Caenorhabditis auriculariae]
MFETVTLVQYVGWILPRGILKFEEIRIKTFSVLALVHLLLQEIFGMNRLFLLAVLFAACYADGDNSTTTVSSVSAAPMCIEYADCVHKAQQKALECHTLENNTEQSKDGKNSACNEARKLHNEVRTIHTELANEVETCVRDKAINALSLSEKKNERCQGILKKNAKPAPIEPQKRRNKKEKSGQKAAVKTCHKEVRRLKSQCQRLAKCCPAARECHQAEDKTQLEEKKKALKAANKECNSAPKDSKKNKKQRGKKDGEEKERDGKKKNGDNKLAKSLDKAQKQRRSAPIGGKKLDLALADMPHA